MKSLKAEGDRFLELTAQLESRPRGGSTSDAEAQNFQALLQVYGDATDLLSFRRGNRLKDAAQFLRDETLRLASTSSNHPLYTQLSSSQNAAKTLFERAISDLVERN